MSPVARKSFLSSFSEVAIESLELDGVFIPDDIEFVRERKIGKR